MTLHPRFFAKSRPSRTRGFALLELIIAISLASIITMFANARMAREMDETLASGSATYLSTIANAAQQHVLLNFFEYANSLPVAGVVQPLLPTLPELAALGRLNGGFPTGASSMPTRQTAAVTINRVNCPGPTCQLQILACTTTPVTLGGADVRFDLASSMVMEMGGTGGQSLMGNGTIIRGPVINAANPYGNTEGIVCGTGAVDTALFQMFVRMSDTRDPNFQGPVTVAGTTTLNGPAVINNTLGVGGPTTLNGATTINNNLTVTGTTALVGNTSIAGCAAIRAATGRAGFGCVNPDAVPAGYAGGVSAPDLVANANILASDNPMGFTGNNTNYVLATANNGTGQAEVRTSGRIAANRLVATGAFAPGSACNAADVGAIGLRPGGSGLVTCSGGTWRDMNVSAATGDACATEGSSANGATGVLLVCMNGSYQAMNSFMSGGEAGTACTTEGRLGIDTTANNQTLICRANPATGGGVARWLRVQDLTSNLSFVQSIEVTHDSVVTKPACTAGAGMTSTPLIQMVPKSFSSVDGGFSLYATEEVVAGAPSWRTHMRIGSGAAMPATARAVAQVFCYFP